jgi:hypothetical protein
MRFARVSLILVILIVLAAFASANCVAHADCIGQEGTTGCLISGEVYGNTSNQQADGTGIDPSWSPGPWVCGDPSDCAGPTNPGGSVGTFVSPVSPEFANGNDPNHDFSAPHIQ